MRSEARRAVTATIAVAALLMAACSGSPPSASSGPSPTPSPTAVPVAPPTAAATPSAQPSASAVSPLPEADQTVFPGTYTTHFQPALTLTVGREVELSCVPGYQCRGDVDVNLPGWVGLEFGNAPAFGLNIVRIDKVSDPQHAGKLIDPPPDLATWIETFPGLTAVTPPASVKVGGLDGIQLDMRCGDKDITFGPIPGVTEFGWGIGAHSQARLIVVAVGGHEVVILVGAAKDSVGQFDAVTWALQPLVDSIVWH